MHCAERGGSEKIDHEVAVRDRVEAVVADAPEAKLACDRNAIDRQRGARQRSRAERHHVRALERLGKTVAVTREHLDVSGQVMSQRYRLRALEMSVAGHHGVQVAAG